MPKPKDVLDVGMFYLLFGEQERRAVQRHAEIIKALNAITKQGDRIMATLQEALEQVKAARVNIGDMHDLFSKFLDFLTEKDRLNAELQKQVAKLIADANIDAAAKAELSAAAAELFAASEAEENTMREALPGVPPVGGTPLATLYANYAEFSAAVAAYTGPEGVTLDGQNAKPGTAPTLDYFTHSADGSISTTGPTD